ncbi:unnamed protein product [Orchesella dallaii]|uniref:Uncharacterized protein n=1 Tax=Orchesella dallaii TaxID=48710 RepID=A0ABP1PYR4_9HEXA
MEGISNNRSNNQAQLEDSFIDYDSADDPENNQSDQTIELPDRDKALITAMERSMKKLIKQELRQSDKKSNSRFQKLTDLIEDKSKANNERFQNLEHENQVLVSKVSLLQRENESLQVELREKNIVISGIQDNENETESELVRKVSDLLKTIVSKSSEPKINFRPDKAHRLGKFTSDKNRHVKVKFATISERDYIFRNKDKVPPQVTVKADIPFTMRRDHAILKQKQAELMNDGLPCTVDMKKRVLYSNGKTFQIVDGKISDCSKSTTPIQSDPTTGEKPPPAKRSRSGEIQRSRFLGNPKDIQPNLRSNSSNPATAIPSSSSQSRI